MKKLVSRAHFFVLRRPSYSGLYILNLYLVNPEAFFSSLRSYTEEDPINESARRLKSRMNYNRFDVF